MGEFVAYLSSLWHFFELVSHLQLYLQGFVLLQGYKMLPFQATQAILCEFHRTENTFNTKQLYYSLNGLFFLVPINNCLLNVVVNFMDCAFSEHSL